MADPMYKEMNKAHKDCIVWAAAYTETMLTRVKAEDPEYFAVKGMNKSEMQAHMIHNYCITYSKFHSLAFRHRDAKMTERNYNKDEIRRLINGGDKFHPYF